MISCLFAFEDVNPAQRRSRFIEQDRRAVLHGPIQHALPSFLLLIVVFSDNGAQSLDDPFVQRLQIHILNPRHPTRRLDEQFALDQSPFRTRSRTEHAGTTPSNSARHEHDPGAASRPSTRSSSRCNR